MRHPPVLLTALLMAAPASAQVTVDLHALDALPSRTGEANVRRLPVITAPGPAVAAARPAAPAPTPPPATGPEQPAPPAATLPESVPPVATIAPIEAAPPPADVKPPPPPAIVANAATAAAAIPKGLRLTYTGDQSDLSQPAADEIRQLVQSTPSTGATTFNVLAYAAGSADDPSVARRLSLSRAIAVRTAMVADGVASSRIYLRALGSQAGDGPPDRVDINVMGANAPDQTKTQ